jgi:hypothetical protein
VPFRMQAKYAAGPVEALAASTTTSPSDAATAAATESSVAAAAAAATGGGGGGGGGGNDDGSTGPPPIVEAIPSRVDAAAKLVTYERYCHVYRCVCRVFLLRWMWRGVFWVRPPLSVRSVHRSCPPSSGPRALSLTPNNNTAKTRGTNAQGMGA